MKITQNCFNQILKKNFLFEDLPKVAVAVSGGPDSIALVSLLKNWINNKGSLIALIIDHQIREDSYIEAIKVKEYLKQNKISSRIFKIKKKNIVSKSMSEARANRFNQLIKYCYRNNIFHLFFAHHYDDILETFLLRKIAGSNFEGLRSIQKNIIINNIQILRPFLEFSKNDIINYNNANNISYINDPSNENLKYSRVVVRNFITKNLKYKKQIEKDFIKIQNYFPYYKKMIFNVFNKLSFYNSKKKVLIDIHLLRYDKEIQIKIVEIVYKLIKPNKKFLRYQKILNLLNILKKRKSCITNLGGMNIKKDDYLISFYA